MVKGYFWHNKHVSGDTWAAQQSLQQVDSLLFSLLGNELLLFIKACLTGENKITMVVQFKI